MDAGTPRRAAWSGVLVGAALVVAFAAALAQPEPPVSDAALFEYYGGAIVHGSRLYTGLWDNKLPSIYLVNGALQLLFGTRYVAHALAEAVATSASVALVAFILRRAAIAWWPLGALVFAAIVSLTTQSFDNVETFALPCILLAYALALGRPGGMRSAVAGAALAAATTFWIPAILLLAPLFVLETRRGPRLALAAGCLGVLAVYAAALVGVFGYAAVAELARSWVAYASHGMTERDPSRGRFGLAGAVVHGFTASGAGTLIALLAAVVRKPSNERERFALAWVICALLAAAAPGKFFEHYFVPSFAPCIFAIGVFGTRVTPRRAAFVAVALVLAWRTAVAQVAVAGAAHADAREEQAVGERVRALAGAGAVIDVEPYGPGIFLAAGARPPDRFGMVPISLRPALRPGLVRPELLIVLSSAGAAVSPASAGAPSCGGYGRWSIYLLRTDDAALAARCRTSPRDRDGAGARGAPRR